jgi:hypothetical protein
MHLCRVVAAGVRASLFVWKPRLNTARLSVDRHGSTWLVFGCVCRQQALRCTRHLCLFGLSAHPAPRRASPTACLHVLRPLNKRRCSPSGVAV